jgi:hypothetical protein
MGRNIGLVIGGMVVFIVGLIIAGVVNSIAATQGTAAAIDSFSGAKNINDLLPTIFYIGLLVVGLGAMGIGAAGAVGRGPTAARRR